MIGRDTAALANALQGALEALLLARSLAGLPMPPPLPLAGLDETLRGHAGYQDARCDIRRAVDQLRPLLDEEGWRVVLGLEAAFNQAIGLAAEIGWSLAWATRDRTGR